MFRYVSVDPGCGGLLHADRGVLSTPRYPQNYQPDLDCSWHVMVTPGFRVSVNFETQFQIQGFGRLCSTGDYVEVRPDRWGTGLVNESTLRIIHVYLNLCGICQRP